MADERPEPGSRLCHHCHADIGRSQSVGRRDTCLKCGSDLHCCLNCRFYAPGHHNDCLESQAERQVDKAAGNFCEYFSFRTAPSLTPARDAKARAQLDGLFKKK